MKCIWQQCSLHHPLQHGHSWLRHCHQTWAQFQPKPFQDFLWQRTSFQRVSQHHWTPGYCTWLAQEHQHQPLLLLLWYLCLHCWLWLTLRQRKGALQHQHGCTIPCIKDKRGMSEDCNSILSLHLKLSQSSTWNQNCCRTSYSDAKTSKWSGFTVTHGGGVGDQFFVRPSLISAHPINPPDNIKNPQFPYMYFQNALWAELLYTVLSRFLYYTIHWRPNYNFHIL